MRIEYAIPCEELTEEAQRPTIVGAGTNLYTLSGFPAEVDVTIAVQLVARIAESVTGELSWRTLGPDLQQVGEDGGFTVTLYPAQNTPEGWETPVVVPVEIVLDVAEPGVYTVVLSIDGRDRMVPFLIRGDVHDD